MLYGVLFLILYLGISFYLGHAIWVWLRDSYAFKKKKTFFLFVVFLILSYPVGKTMGFLPFEIIGGYWNVMVVYSIFLLPILTGVYFICKRKYIKWLGFAATIFYIVIFSVGTFNAWNPVIKTYSVEIDTNAPQEDITILAASDFHLNEMIRNGHIQRFVDLSNDIKPDIILLPGDIIDGEVDPFLEHNMGEAMKKIKAPLGVYASLGNHEYYNGDIPVILKEMEKAGVKVLTDESLLINDSFYVLGREDYHNKNRKPLEELVKGLEKDKPIIMLEHQPVEFDIASENGIDLSISGHAHRAQLYPGYLITQALFENDYGYMKKENLHTVVTSGFGLWGPPVRIGSRSEVVVVHVDFKDKK